MVKFETLIGEDGGGRGRGANSRFLPAARPEPEPAAAPVEPGAHAAGVREVAYLIMRPDGTPVATHVRIETEGKPKRFLWQRDGKPGLGGIAVTEVPLYRSEILPSLAIGRTVVVTEGEKAADALLAAGVPAVATVTGASSCPAPAMLACLRGFTVVLWADNDDVGYAHMLKVAKAMHSVCEDPPLILRWEEGGPHADAADFCLSLPHTVGVSLVDWILDAAVDYDPATHAMVTTVREWLRRCRLRPGSGRIGYPAVMSPSWLASPA